MRRIGFHPTHCRIREVDHFFVTLSSASVARNPCGLVVAAFAADVPFPPVGAGVAAPLGVLPLPVNLQAASPAQCPTMPHLKQRLLALSSASLAPLSAMVRLLRTTLPPDFPPGLPLPLDFPFAWANAVCAA
eukprot:s5647_g2.t1